MPDRQAGPKARDPSAQANGLGTQTLTGQGAPMGRDNWPPHRLDVDGIATLQAALRIISQTQAVGLG